MVKLGDRCVVVGLTRKSPTGWDGAMKDNLLDESLGLCLLNDSKIN